MTTEKQPNNTPRRRRSFGVKDLRRLHRRSSGEKQSMRSWVHDNYKSIKPAMPTSDMARQLMR